MKDPFPRPPLWPLLLLTQLSQLGAEEGWLDVLPQTFSTLRLLIRSSSLINSSPLLLSSIGQQVLCFSKIDLQVLSSSRQNDPLYFAPARQTASTTCRGSNL